MKDFAEIQTLMKLSAIQYCVNFFFFNLVI